MKKSQIILLASVFVLLIIIWLVPKYKPGSADKYIFDYESSEIKSVEYKNANLHFTLTPIINNNQDIKTFWNVQVHYVGDKNKNKQKTNSTQNITNSEAKKQEERNTQKEILYEFTGSSQVGLMVEDLIKLKYKGETEDNPTKYEEYGLQDCLSYIKLAALNDKNTICLGKANYNKTNKYISIEKNDNSSPSPSQSKKTYVVSIYIFNRYEADILPKVENKLFPYDSNTIKHIHITFHKKITAKYPLLFPNGKNFIEVFSKEEFDEKSGKDKTVWKFKDLSKSVNSRAGSIKSIFSSLNLPLVISRIKSNPSKNPWPKNP